MTRDVALLIVGVLGSICGTSGPRGPVAAQPPAESHWAFQSVERPALPTGRENSAQHPIDLFVGANLRDVGLLPGPEASRVTLIRRLSLDLTGLPPTLEDVDNFLADPSPDAYERLLDRLLASPHYGEHMARFWLDVARYADTFGLHQDDYQSVYPYRDWVVDAFNRNLSYDRFTIEQLAGDLLTSPGTGQLTATGFNRCHVSTNEGGVIEEEFLVRYAVDRTVTTATVWMGLTAGCASCHDHKFDPMTMKEFYSLMAFFNNVDEKGRNGGRPAIEPTLRLWSAESSARHAELEKKIEKARAELKVEATLERRESLTTLENERQALLTTVPVTMVMRDRKEPRPNHVLVRGQYDQPGATVQPGVPAWLPPLPPTEEPSRLGFARWLVRRDHPLTARVAVNRLWQQLFGVGLVDTPDDFGTQGSLPSHPELLDFLAWRFMTDGWDVKKFVRWIVTAGTYRQSSHATERTLELDPQNRLLSRGPRFRLDGERIRDGALAASGLLVRDFGGRPVKPYQPAGLWEAVAHHASPTYTYAQDKGRNLYRRSLYTVWKRAAPPPMMRIFDAPNRDACVVSRARTNTPLQALLTLNDVQLVEAARHLAARVLRKGTAERFDDGPTSDEARIVHLFRLTLARPPDPEERRLLGKSLNAFRVLYAVRPELAERLLQFGEGPTDAPAPPVEFAAWVLLCNQVLNLDEFLTKE